jgi:hypothetical protein
MAFLRKKGGSEFLNGKSQEAFLRLRAGREEMVPVIRNGVRREGGNRHVC